MTITQSMSTVIETIIDLKDNFTRVKRRSQLLLIYHFKCNILTKNGAQGTNIMITAI